MLFRSYALLALLGALATYCLLRWTAPVPEGRTSRRRVAWLTAYALFTSAMTYTHVYSVFVIVAHGLTLAVDAAGRRPPRWRRLEWWTIAQLAVAAAFLPWLSILSRQFDTVERGFWIGPTHVSMIVWPVVTYAGSLPLALVLVPCAFVGLFVATRHTDEAGDLSAQALLLPWLVCPVALPLVASLVGSSIFLPKYTIAASVPFALLSAHGLAQLRRRWSIALIVAVLVIASTWPRVDAGVSSVLTAAGAGSDVRTIATGSTLTTYYTRQRKDGWRDAVWNIETKARPGDAVIFYPFFNQIPFDVYHQRRDLPEVAFPKDAAGFTAPTLAETLHTLAAPHARVWFVVLQLEERKPLLVSELEREFVHVTRIREWHIDVYLCEDRNERVPLAGNARSIGPHPSQ